MGSLVPDDVPSNDDLLQVLLGAVTGSSPLSFSAETTNPAASEMASLQQKISPSMDSLIACPFPQGAACGEPKSRGRVSPHVWPVSVDSPSVAFRHPIQQAEKNCLSQP